MLRAQASPEVPNAFILLRTCFAKFGAGIAEVDRLLNELEQNLESAKLSLKRGFTPDLRLSSD